MAASIGPASDPCSFSKPESIVTEHLLLKLNVDFEKQILKGTATLSFERKKDVDLLVLDTRDLKIHKVTLDPDGQSLQFNIGDAVHTFGCPLEIKLPSGISEKFSISIDYETSPKSTALQWLKPQQTLGKVHPYLFSQCQAIHARSMLPCQDTPAVKMTYEAEVTAPSSLVALMSALRQEEEKVESNKEVKTYSFHQKVPIPSYLIAIVVGALESRDIGPRSKVWCEKEMVEEAAREFDETENMLSTAESIMGPYVWGVYDILVLPPSFPYGGMENPCLTFVTPSLLAGDKSLADVIAHEISHSWTGNLVTNSSPEHFWLNEGHTMFVERKIAGRARGVKCQHFEAVGGWKTLRNEVEEVLGCNHAFTHLVPNLNGVDPDDAFSTVPYEKGYALLMYLEQKLGGPEVYEPFLRAYIEHFKYQSISTKEWKDYLYEYFKDKAAILNDVDWEAWFHKPGMPPVKPEYDTSMVDTCTNLGNKWNDVEDVDSLSSEDLKDLNSYQIREFLAELLEKAPLTKEKVNKMEKLYGFNSVKNAEIRFRWIRLCLRAKLEESVPMAIDFVNTYGRMKFARPVYRDLFNWEFSRQAAIDNYHKHSSEMHFVSASMVGKDLKIIT